MFLSSEFVACPGTHAECVVNGLHRPPSRAPTTSDKQVFPKTHGCIYPYGYAWDCAPAPLPRCCSRLPGLSALQKCWIQCSAWHFLQTCHHLLHIHQTSTIIVCMGCHTDGSISDPRRNIIPDKIQLMHFPDARQCPTFLFTIHVSIFRFATSYEDHIGVLYGGISNCVDQLSLRVTRHRSSSRQFGHV
jgi:hypothetical protein